MPELKLGRLGYGAANLGNLNRAMSDDDARDILDEAWALGVRYFDTAPHYGLGLSERRLGEFLRTKPRAEFVLSTKVGRLLRPNSAPTGRDSEGFDVRDDLERVFDPSPAGIRASLAESLERMGLDRVDILFLHDPEIYDLDRGIDEGLPALAGMRDEGLVAQVGVGSMSTETLLRAAQSGAVDLMMVAGRYTLVDQPVIPEVTEACARNGVGMVTAAIFNSGLLARPTIPADARYDYGEAPSEIMQRAQRIVEVCSEFDVELPTAALQYTLRNPIVRSVIVGASSPAQLQQNWERMSAPISEEFWTALVGAGLVPA